MKVHPHIFKAYDVRGEVGTELTPELAQKIGKVFADWLPSSGPVAVGRDMRPDSKELAISLIEGLAARGREVWDIGQVTSDMIYFATGNFGLAGGAVVTASHNPGKYNGIKFCREKAGGVGLDSGLAEIRDAVLGDVFKPAASGGIVISKNIVKDWIRHTLSFVKGIELKPYKIAIDAGNGMAGAIIPSLEEFVPFEITPLYFELDGTFPNHEANPLKAETLKDLRTVITKNGLDLGIAFDGDGDRALLIDEKGEPLSGSVSTAILAKYFLEKNPGATVLYNAICSRIVPETVSKYGGTPIRTQVGHSIIKGKMVEHSAVFAGEHSSHYYFRNNFHADSGLIAAMVAMGVLSSSGKRLSELAEEFRIYFNSPEINFEIEDKQAMIEKVAKEFSDGKQDRLDGLTVNYDSWWFNLRPSNTEPLLRLNVEASSAELLKEQTNRLESLIK